MSNKLEAKTMTPESKRVLKPKLRFPEFQDAPGWTETVLADVLTEHGLKNYGNWKVHSVSVHKGIVDQIEHLGRSYAAADTSNYSLVKPHDIVYTKSPTGDFPFGIVKQSSRPHNVIVSPLYGVFSPINKHLGYIIDTYFESPIRTNNYLAPIAHKGAKNTIQISNETFLSKGIYLPSDVREQQRIAEYLTSIDELIAAHGQKLVALKSYRKGLMRKLFPDRGETVPRLRFPEFRHNGAWVGGKAGSVFKNRLDRGEEGLPIYSVTIHDGMVRRDSLDRNYYDIEEASGNKKACKNDIAYNMMRMWQGALGVAPEDCLVSPAYIVLVPQKPAVSRFFEYLFKLPSSLQLLTSYSRGLTKDRLRLYYDDFAGIPLCYPNDPEEQQRIADCLTILDEQITAQSRRLEVLKQYKQAMIQQLFPSPEEVEA
jgi:type I restriction enzyme S subunit